MAKAAQRKRQDSQKFFKTFAFLLQTFPVPINLRAHFLFLYLFFFIFKLRALPCPRLPSRSFLSRLRKGVAVCHSPLLQPLPFATPGASFLLLFFFFFIPFGFFTLPLYIRLAIHIFYSEIHRRLLLPLVWCVLLFLFGLNMSFWWAWLISCFRFKCSKANLTCSAVLQKW